MKGGFADWIEPQKPSVSGSEVHIHEISTTPIGNDDAGEFADGQTLVDQHRRSPCLR
jgi:hypothetical protein